MEEYENLIRELSDLAGIIPEYYDIFGKKHVLSKESRAAILSAMDLKVGTPDEVRAEIEKKKLRPWLDALDPVAVISVYDQPYRLQLRIPLPEGGEQAVQVSVTIGDEQGKKELLEYRAGALPVQEQRVIKDRRFVRTELPLPHREIGYYNVTVVCSHPDPVFDHGARSFEKSCRLIVTPDICFMPEELQRGKTWGVAVNLYGIRSGRNWGVGDFGDLRGLVAWLSGLEAGVVGINPLHAIPNTAPFGISPYSPVSRLYRNFIYIDLQDVPEIGRIAEKADIARKAAQLRESERVDYERVAAVKRDLLEQAFRVFSKEHYRKDTRRGREFREYARTEGEALEKYALFLALSEYLAGEHQAAEWPEWPEEYRSPKSAAVEAFRKNNRERVLFFSYVQWLIDVQLAEVSAAASRVRMPVGLYGDLAIGAHDRGSDGWIYQDTLAERVTVGAPPDDFNHNGQDWGFPPMIPEKLRESGYELFIETIRKNMQHMGALRIDHALGLFRLFWIPKGMKAAEGAYVRSNAEDQLRIIALESVRNRTLVVGEDLGTITDEARQALHRFGILSYRLFYFERNYPDPAFLPPERYPAMALSAVTTHDLPTLSGYWAGRDIEVKKRLGITSDDGQYQRQKSERERDRALMLQALAQRGLVQACPTGDSSCIPAMTPELCRAIYEYLSLSPTKLVLVSLDDIIGTMDQQNLPGTVSEYPNWMQKTPMPLEEITVDQRFQDLAAMFRRQLVQERR